MTEKIKNILEYYLNNPSLSLFAVLHLYQREKGYISEQDIKEISEILGIDKNRIVETASFYHFFNLFEKGEKVFYICTNISCALNGAYDILEFFKENEERLGIEVKECECIGLCDFAPAGLYKFKPIKNLSIEKIKEEAKNEKR
jgi:NADH:ubiquinone oxidoreductase subunit E